MRLNVVLVGVVAVSLLAATLGGAQEACYIPGYDVMRTGVSPYEFKFPPVLSWQFTSSERRADEPVAGVAVGPDLVYAPIGSSLYGLNRTTGAQKFKFALGGKSYCTPVLYGDTVLIGTEGKQLIAVKADTGQRLWSFPVTAAVRGEPLIFEDVLYFGSDDGNVYALDLQTRQLRWYFPAGGKVRGGLAYYRENVYFATDRGYLIAVNAKDGRQIWNTSLGTESIYSSPVIERRRILIAAGSDLIACDVDNGTIAWSFPTFGLITGRPVVKDRMVFVGSHDGSLYCINGANGRGIWRYPREGTLEAVSSSPTLQGDQVVFRSGRRLILAVSADPAVPADRRLVWQYTLPQPPERRPAAGQPGPGGMPGMDPAMQPMDPGAGMPGGPDGTGRTRRTRQVVEIKWEEVMDPGLMFGDGGAYVIGDDHVVYGFDNKAADNNGPSITDCMLDIRGQRGYQVRYRLPVDRGDTFPGRWADLVEVPGAPPISVSIVVSDAGCGVNPSSITVKFDDAPPEATYDARQALLWYIYDPRGAAVALRNGVRNLAIECADWLGNTSTAQVSFTVDNSLPQPAPPRPVQPDFGPGMDPGMMPGGPGMPGGPMPGMPGI